MIIFAARFHGEIDETLEENNMSSITKELPSNVILISDPDCEDAFSRSTLLDVDEGVSMQDAVELLEPFTSLIQGLQEGSGHSAEEMKAKLRSKISITFSEEVREQYKEVMERVDGTKLRMVIVKLVENIVISTANQMVDCAHLFND